jgi:hypothetical protein
MKRLFRREILHDLKRSRAALLLFLPLAAGILTAFTLILHAQTTALPVQGGAGSTVDWSSASDMQVLLQAVEMTPTVPADSTPRYGTFYSAQHAPGTRSAWPPLPGNPYNLPVWNLGDGVYLLADEQWNYSPPLMSSSLASGGMMATDGMGPPPFDTGDGGDDSNIFTNFYTLPTNGLWLEMTNVANGFACLNLHGATDAVYEVLSKTDLTIPSWNIETELWPTDTNSTPFTVPESGRPNLFIWARDWTGVTENGNTTPDWWFYYYFGTTALSDTNLDSQGNTLLSDYQSGTDPNIIQFSIEVADNYVNTSYPNLQLNITAGVPSCCAVLVDSTNFAGANWTTYTSSTVTANLGTLQGWHDIWIGLRGLPSNATQTWQWKRLKLDFTPPQIVVTNPAVQTVDVPTIQLQGYSPEQLSGISYDLTNANGLVTNQPVFITGQNFSTNTWESTTNVFQGFDIPLTNGLNTITIHATDMAGNVTTTNFDFTVDYSGKTNPPLTQVCWPLNGQQVCGASFLCQGWVSDPTVCVLAELVDINNTTNTFTANMGRDGHFWLENLPLNGVTNWLTLTVTDVVGNAFTTNLIILSGDAGLNIDPVSAGQTTVTGEINAGNDTVWVNGAQAINNGDGAWTATITPISGMGGAVEAVAIPNSDNNGNGSGGMDAAGNPKSTRGQSAQSPVNPPQGVYIVSSTYQDREDYLGDEYIEGGSSWADDAGGWGWGQSFDGSTWDESVAWPSSPWPEAVPWGVLWVTNNGQFLLTTHRPASLSFHYANEKVIATDPVTGSSFSESAQGALEFATGGPLGSKAVRLYQFSGSVTIHHSPQPPDDDEVPWSIPPDDETVADGRVSLENLGNLDANGNVYAQLADNTRVLVTGQTKGANDYSTPPPSPVGVTLTGLTVVSNSATQIDATNWAAVKSSSTNDYVYIQATLSTDDTNAANQIQWSAGEKVPGNPFAVRVTKTNSVETTVTATLGSTNMTVKVWIVWATCNFDMNSNDTLSTVTSGALTFLNPRLLEPFDNDNLGAGYFNWSQQYFDTAITASGSIIANQAAGKMCVTASITPAGINKVTGINSLGWRIFQQRNCEAFKNGTLVSNADDPIDTTGDWVSDSDADASGKNMTTEPDSNDKLYHSDAATYPTARFGANNSAAEYSNFKDLVIWNGQLCSSTNNFWHCNFAWTPTSNPQQANNWGFNTPDLNTGNPPLP